MVKGEEASDDIHRTTVSCVRSATETSDDRFVARREKLEEQPRSRRRWSASQRLSGRDGIPEVIGGFIMPNPVQLLDLP